MSWAIFGLVLFLPYGVRGTLTPNGTVALDCGGQQEFTCDVSDITTGVALAGWRIDRLFNITAPGINGLRVANDNIRVTTTTGGNVPRSTITIANFDMRDNGGTVQCINTDDSTIQGTATISVAIPSCTSITANNDLNDECTSATVNWQHSLSNTPLVTSVTVTYCPTSSPNCGNSMKCTASPCTITGLTPIEDHYLTVIPNNNCGSPTGCTGNIPTRGIPSCPISGTSVTAFDYNGATVTWQQPPNTPPVTFTTVTYCPTSSPNCGNSRNCTTSPCNISGLDPGTEYQFTVIPNNNCGSPTGCTGNTATAEIACSCAVRKSEQTSIVIPVVAGIIPSAIVIVVNIISIVVVFFITRHCYKHTSQKGSPLKSDGQSERVKGPHTYDDIPMTNSPAYGPVK